MKHVMQQSVILLFECSTEDIKKRILNARMQITCKQVYSHFGLNSYQKKACESLLGFESEQNSKIYTNNFPL